MVDVKSQYVHIKNDVNAAIQEVIDSAIFINGPIVSNFTTNLSEYLGVGNVIPCANGTDALQIALMALGLQPGDEVIVPAFTYVATAEVIALLKLKPIMVDVDPDTFNLTGEIFEKAITPKTKAVVPVHLYGQCSDMESIMKIAAANNIKVVEDNAQAIGSEYTFSDGKKYKAGTIGDIGTTSFYPSKNLGAYGDGGAIFSNDDNLAKNLKMIANHGQSLKYVHDIIGCNSRLDAIQAAILNVKLNFLDKYAEERNKVANQYDKAFKDVDEITTPYRFSKSSHVFHQYTIKIKSNKRDDLKQYLLSKGVPSMIYYPIPLYKQKAFSIFFEGKQPLKTTEQLCDEVISLPIHTEMSNEQITYIIENVISFFKL